MGMILTKKDGPPWAWHEHMYILFRSLCNLADELDVELVDKGFVSIGGEITDLTAATNVLMNN